MSEEFLDDKSDWNPPQPQTLPRPTYWPAVLALGITLLAWGLVTYILVSGVGLLLFSIALAGWIAEVRLASLQSESPQGTSGLCCRSFNCPHTITDSGMTQDEGEEQGDA